MLDIRGARLLQNAVMLGLWSHCKHVALLQSWHTGLCLLNVTCSLLVWRKRVKDSSWMISFLTGHPHCGTMDTEPDHFDIVEPVGPRFPLSRNAQRLDEQHSRTTTAVNRSDSLALTRYAF